MHPLQLTFVLRLIAGDVKKRSQRVSVCGLHSVIGAEVDECSVIGAKVLVETCRSPATHACCRSRWSCNAVRTGCRRRIPAVPVKSRASAILQRVGGGIGAGRVVVDVEHALIERQGSRLRGCDVGEHGGLESRSGHVHAGRRLV